MSAPAADAHAAAPPAKGKKKLIIIVAVALLVVLLGGGGAVVMMKKKAAEAAAAAEAEESGEEAPAHKTEHKKSADHKAPVFVPLEPFTVNLADKEQDRYAQVGITLEVEDAHVCDELKAYMPAIRSNILMVLSHKTSTDLLSKDGKDKLAREILRESVRPMGIELEEEEPEEEVEEEKPSKKKKKKKKKKAAPASPVLRVHFNNFIIQ